MHQSPGGEKGLEGVEGQGRKEQWRGRGGRRSGEGEEEVGVEREGKKEEWRGRGGRRSGEGGEEGGVEREGRKEEWRGREGRIGERGEEGGVKREGRKEWREKRRKGDIKLQAKTLRSLLGSLMPSPCAPPGEKWSGE